MTKGFTSITARKSTLNRIRRIAKDTGLKQYALLDRMVEAYEERERGESNRRRAAKKGDE